MRKASSSPKSPSTAGHFSEAEIRVVRLIDVHLDARNPRTDGAGENLDALIASLRGVGLVQPPILIPENNGTYRVLVGERRVRAAKQAGFQEIPCIVTGAPLNALAAHRARVVENLHRRELNPIDHALSLRVAWLLANAEALGLRDESERLMAEDRPLKDILPDLENLLKRQGFHSTTPAVTWEETLDMLGVEMSSERRKKLLRLLSMPSEIQELLRDLPVTEAAARALGRLKEEEQRQIVQAVAEQPDLARRLRRISRAVHDQGYSVSEALAEARGEFVGSEHQEGHKKRTTDFESDSAVVAAVMNFLEASNQMIAALDDVRSFAPQTLDIPEPWRGYFDNAIETIRSSVQ